jgi:hypothetical protein
VAKTRLEIVVRAWYQGVDSRVALAACQPVLVGGCQTPEPFPMKNPDSRTRGTQTLADKYPVRLEHAFAQSAQMFIYATRTSKVQIDLRRRVSRQTIRPKRLAPMGNA